MRQLAIKCRCRCNGGRHAHIQGHTASGDSSSGEFFTWPGLRSGESSGFRSNAQVSKFHAADHSVNTRVVSPRGSSGAAGFCKLQLRVHTGCDGRVFDARSLQSTSCLLPSFVCRLGCLLNIQLRRCLLIIVKCAESGGDVSMAPRRGVPPDLLREKACPNCVSDHSLDTRFGCDESSQVCRSSGVSRSYEPNS